MAARHYKRTALTSFEGSLQSLAIKRENGPLTQYYDLRDGDTARVDLSLSEPTYPGTSMDFIYDSTGTDENDSPRVIRPTDYDTEGPGVWRLIKTRAIHLTADTLELTDATQGVVMTPAERTKLSGIEDNANAYVHPADHDDQYYNETEMDSFLAGKEDAFTKNTAFNKDFGSAADTVCEGDDSRLSDARTPVPHAHDASDITSGTIDIARLPQGALEVLVHAADQTARFALTTNEVQNGDTVQQDDTGVMYRVTDDTNLDSEAGYTEYTAGAATSVPWTGVTGKPSTYPPDTHDHGDIYYTETEMDSFLAGKEDAFTKNTAFNKDFGTATDTVCEGDDSRLSDARTPVAHDLGGAEHNAATLAELNAKVSDAVLIDTNDSRLSNARTPVSHGNEAHSSAFITSSEAPVQSVAGKTGDVTLDPADAGAEPAFTKNTAFNKNFGSAADTVCEGSDARLTDERTPTSHASTHISGGSDTIANAVAGVSSGLLSAADKTRLDGIAWHNIDDQPEDAQIYNNLLDPSVWAEGGTGTQGMFTAVGGTSANVIVLGVGPGGVDTTLWKCTPQDSTTEDGGWSDSRISIDKTKTYRFILFAKRTTAAEGTIDFGIVDNGSSDSDIEVWTAGGSTLVTIPDFKAAFDPPELDRWYMLVGYVLPTSYAGTQQNYGGVYDCMTGQRIASCTDYQWGASAIETGSKALYENSTDSSTALAYFAAPRIDMMSGSEVPTMALLHGVTDNNVAHLEGEETFTGQKTFSTNVKVSPGLYSATDGVVEIYGDENYSASLCLLEASIAQGVVPYNGFEFKYDGVANELLLRRYVSSSTPSDVFDCPRTTGVIDFKIAPTINSATIWTSGNDSTLAHLAGAETFIGAKTFNTHTYLNNGAYFYGKDSGSTIRFLIGIASDKTQVASIALPTDIKSNGTLTHNGTETIWTSGNDSNLAKLNAANVFTTTQEINNGGLLIDHSVGGTNGTAIRLLSNANESALASNNYYSSGSKYSRTGGSTYIKSDISTGATAGDIVMSTAASGAADAAVTYSERFRIKQAGEVQVTTGPLTVAGSTVYHTGNDSLLEKVYKEIGSTTILTASATLTAAQIDSRIVRVGTAATENVSITLPTESAMDTYFANMDDNTTFELCICNEDATYTGTIVNSDWSELVGNMTIATESSVTFLIRKTSSTSWLIYRAAG